MSRLNHVVQFGAASLLAVSGLFAAGSASAERSVQYTGAQPSNLPVQQAVVPVVLGEYFIRTLPQVESGVVAFQVGNVGDKTHNFIIEGNGLVKATPDLNTGDGSVLTVELAPGTYNLLCDVSDHIDRGMVGQLVVVGGAPAPAAEPAAPAVDQPAAEPAVAATSVPVEDPAPAA